VGLVHPMMAPGFGIALAVAAAALLVSGSYTAASLAPLFLLQSLASSTGFLVPARRGHYDLLLTGGHHRIAIGIVHWAVSVAPGVAGWLAVVAIEMSITGRAVVSFAPGTLAGMFLISTLPWAATVPLPRLSGGLIWLTVLALVVSTPFQSGRDPFMSPETAGPIVTTLTVLICPWFLVGRGLTGADAIPAGVAAAIAAASVAYACVWIDRADVPLETAQ
jgi:hypothetical protein